MTQDAVVTKLVSRHVAEVEVERGTACGGTCESCEACERASAYGDGARLAAGKIRKERKKHADGLF